jgi:hypothetical protein
VIPAKKKIRVRFNRAGDRSQFQAYWGNTMRQFTRLVLLIAAVCAFALSAAADTLEMRDGRVLNGRYLGGTQSQVRFEVNGKVELYSVDKILALTFGGDARIGDDDSVARPAPQSLRRQSGDAVTVAAGTRILVRMIDSVDSDKNHVGDKFRASLESDLEVDGVVVAPKGTDVYGRLSEAKEAGHMAGKSELKLELTDILINQKLQPIMTGEYELAGKSRGSNTAKKVGGGAVAGAVIGAIAGGGKGAAIGAGVGAGAGTAIQVFTRGDQVRVPSETMLEFRIEQPFTVTPAGTK